MAGKGKKTFVAGEILLAQDVNEYLMDQSVMNFASSAARSSAIPTPTEGMTSYRTDIRQIEFYDGTRWRGASGLVLIKTQAITSGASTVTVTDAFSSAFDNYRIVFSNITMAGIAQAQFQVGASNTGYYSTQTLGSATGYSVASGTMNFASLSNTATYDLGMLSGNTTATNSGGFLELQNPFTATSTAFQSMCSDARTGGVGTRAATGFHNVAASYSSFNFLVSSTTFTGGNISVYGYSK